MKYESRLNLNNKTKEQLISYLKEALQIIQNQNKEIEKLKTLPYNIHDTKKTKHFTR